MPEPTIHRPDDTTIVLLIMEKDEDGLRALLKAHGAKAMGFLRRRFADQIRADELEDVVWIAAHKAWKGIEQYDDRKASLGTWFVAIARNAAIDYLRGRSTEEAEPLADPAEFADPWTAEADAEETPKQRKLRKTLDELLARLPRLQGEVMLADLAANGAADSHRLAARLGSTVPAIQTARSKARRTLRDELTRRGFAPTEGAADER